MVRIILTNQEACQFAAFEVAAYRLAAEFGIVARLQRFRASVARLDLEDTAAVIGMHSRRTAPLELDAAHKLGEGTQRIHGVDLHGAGHRLALGVLWGLERLHVGNAVVVIDQGPALLPAPGAIAEELQWVGQAIVPIAADRVDLLATVEEADKAGGVVVEVDTIVPRSDAEEDVHLHDFKAGGVGIVGEIGLGDLRLSDRWGGHEQQEEGAGRASHRRYVAPRKRECKAATLA